MNMKSKELINFATSDIPSASDCLGVELYYNGIARFISECRTPLTMSIMGDWGTGKTTAMLLIEKELLEKYGEKCHTMWFRTWQYSKFGMEENMTLALLTNLQIKLSELNNKKSVSDADKRQFLGTGIDCFTGLVSNKTGDGIAERINKGIKAFAGLDSIVDTSMKIESLKANIQKSIDEIITKEGERLVIFVDDLDRLEPAVAVDLLEGIKNFMDCEKCVFILAVDSEVIYQGIKCKFGSDIGGDREKKFFDKIIQVPFTLPVTQYDLKPFLKQFVADDELLAQYENITRKKIGTNPRSIKRVFNLLELHTMIMQDVIKKPEDKLSLFVILLIQMTNKEQYNRLVYLARTNERMLREEIQGEAYRSLREVFMLSSDDSINSAANGEAVKIDAKKGEGIKVNVKKVESARVDIKKAGDEKLTTKKEENTKTGAKNEAIRLADDKKEEEEDLRWSSFIEILISTSNISSTPVSEEQDEPNFESSTENFGKSISTLCSRLLFSRISPMGQNMLSIVSQTENGGTCRTKIRKTEYNTINIIIYPPSSGEFLRPNIAGLYDKSAAGGNGEIGYYFSNSCLTLVNIPYNADVDLLCSVLNFYGISTAN